MSLEHSANQASNMPGAFPETPADESGPQHNKLHKRNDLRGWTESNQTPRDHGYMDSRTAGLGGSSSAENGNYTHSNNVLTDPISENHDRVESPTVQKQTTSAAQPHGKHEHGAIKPGVTTDAYSRVGNSYPVTADDGMTGHTTGDKTSGRNPLIQEDVSTIPEKAPGSNGNHLHMKGAGPTAVSTGVVAASETDRDSSTLSERDRRNLVRNGGARPETHNEEPYWGDMPRGAGVYNTVVGTGSDQNTLAPGSSRHQAAAPSPYRTDRDNITMSNGNSSRHSEGLAGDGVHNTVIGSGSDEDRSAVTHQRVFPLMPSHYDTTTSRESQHQDSSSRFKEDLVEAGTGAGQGNDRRLGRSSDVSPRHTPDSTQKNNDLNAQKYRFKEPKDDSETQHHLGRDAALAGAGGAAAGYSAHKYAPQDDEKQNHRQDYASGYQVGSPYSQQKISSAPGVQQNDTYRERSSAAAAVNHGGDDPATRNANAANLLESSINTGHSNDPYAKKNVSTVSEADKARGNDSHLGHNTALLGAGAAWYGAEKHTHRNDDKMNAQPQQAADTPTTTHGSINTTAGHGAVHDPSHRGSSKIPSDGTPAGINADKSQYDTASPTRQRGFSVPSSTPAAAGAVGAGAFATRDRAADDKQQQHQQTQSRHKNNPSVSSRASTDSSHGRKYNVLSSGTPSGINISLDSQSHDPRQMLKEKDREARQRTPSSTGATSGTTNKSLTSRSPRGSPGLDGS